MNGDAPFPTSVEPLLGSYAPLVDAGAPPISSASSPGARRVGRPLLPFACLARCEGANSAAPLPLPAIAGLAALELLWQVPALLEEPALRPFKAHGRQRAVSPGAGIQTNPVGQ